MGDTFPSVSDPTEEAQVALFRSTGTAGVSVASNLAKTAGDAAGLGDDSVAGDAAGDLFSFGTGLASNTAGEAGASAIEHGADFVGDAWDTATTCSSYC